MWGRPGDSNLQEEKEHGSRWFVFTRRLKAFSSARWLSFFATFSGKVPEVGKRKAGHLKAKVSPKKLFPKLVLQRRLEYPGRERCKLPPGPGGGGRSVCALARGPGGGHGCSARAACPLRPGPRPADRWTRRESVGPSARPLAALDVLCGLRAAAAPAFSLQRGWRVGCLFFFSPFFARVCLCVRAKYLYLGNERWALAARGEPSAGVGKFQGSQFLRGRCLPHRYCRGKGASRAAPLFCSPAPPEQSAAAA